MDLADIVSLTHPLFRYGFPYQVPRFIPIRTDAHFIMFDRVRVGPQYTMHRIFSDTAPKTVDRDDDFISEFTLPTELQTTEAHYSAWNRDNPSDPMDKGHQTGSQVRRTNFLVQHDVDSLAGCCPETPSLNRVVKNQLESQIVDRATKHIDVRCVQGPAWYRDSPRGKLASGQWIPDALWISTLWRPNMTDVHCITWLMDNHQDSEKINLRTVALDDIERLTGLVLWDRIKQESFVRSRSKPWTGTWP